MLLDPEHMTPLNRNSKEYVANGIYMYKDSKYMTIYAYRLENNFGEGTSEINSRLANVIQASNMWIPTEPDFGPFRIIKGYPEMLLSLQLHEKLYALYEVGNDRESIDRLFYEWGEKMEVQG
ncbi:hypothetical protein [Thalassotalea crassostreae]|uniref:hypothetical protein n=1 Tax=Thalassotalea crassostreae TaxID=1763536 RepID=UPI000838C9F7|nr:hypothetical protein [Thalassotalea crassostreae]